MDVGNALVIAQSIDYPRSLLPGPNIFVHRMRIGEKAKQSHLRDTAGGGHRGGVPVMNMSVGSDGQPDVDIR